MRWTRQFAHNLYIQCCPCTIQPDGYERVEGFLDRRERPGEPLGKKCDVGRPVLGEDFFEVQAAEKDAGIADAVPAGRFVGLCRKLGAVLFLRQVAAFCATPQVFLGTRCDFNIHNGRATSGAGHQFDAQTDRNQPGC